MGYVVEPPEVTSVAVHGSDDRFPVRRIYCVGRNYAAHAREMGHDPDREVPFYFTKPRDAIVENGADVPYPTLTENYHFEAELVVAINKSCTNVSVEDALDHVYGYAVGNDLTRRDLQGEAKKKGRPWDVGKAFDNSAPCAEIHTVDQVGHIENARIWLSVNDEIKQDSDVNKLIWSVAEVIANLSTLFTLETGDLIYTGTPEGVGPVVKGDVIKVGVDGLTSLETKIV
ncbi:MAG: fumarylacetoacetate hydrolase family protein [Kordiimonadaceae bacterium]|jgi:fumarylpyruvate hydrolase|nr:fumarylacetoacetate hydrolase family protein [Kordiimonadaceae bacterium]MBT6036107.1 fumarylacetoacetate hydrolase family protein [Kordiimonadaceae bacterium]MBT6330473.1 fumarylacetoacetate hydrolase family protein [Kordiimonadaceae bacterium]MBT7582747.1 fumarylacetoacetate hydrolase family protein [Kordiimonadaceae bacterium]